jgi:uncharacterized delta-60 repeat protein
MKHFHRIFSVVAVSTAIVTGLAGCGGPPADNNPPTGVTVVKWAKSYRGINPDYLGNIVPTSDGGYLIAGQTDSFGAGNSDIWLLKLDADGATNWQKTFGGSNNDYGQSVQQTSDGGYIVAGYTYSYGAGSADIWVLKLDANGNSSWQKTFGGTSFEEVTDVKQTSDGGYIVVGSTYSFDAGGGDIWVLKLDANGTTNWQKSYGGGAEDGAMTVQQTSDGGYIVGGFASMGAGLGDIWILKLNGTGIAEWQYTIGGADSDSVYSVLQTTDGGYLLAGNTLSFGASGYDIWLLKLNSNGTTNWQKTYGGSADEYAKSIQQTSDGGFIIAGNTASFGKGGADVLALKIDGLGNILWQNTFGGTNNDMGQSVRQTSDGGYIIGGYSYSWSASFSDIWVLKLDANGELPGAAFMSNASLTVANTSVNGVSTNIAGIDSAATIQVTPVAGVDTAAVVIQQYTNQ